MVRVLSGETAALAARWARPAPGQLFAACRSSSRTSRTAEIVAAMQAALSGARLFYCVARSNKPIGTSKWIIRIHFINVKNE
ncbi:hypothetical protein XAR_0304 [Xanthomonas citri pv. glycines str. 8ra]|nr:hypothetical protein XAR_0304 [Xanthomonas citri pv. glycines str. 8ra]